MVPQVPLVPIYVSLIILVQVLRNCAFIEKVAAIGVMQIYLQAYLWTTFGRHDLVLPTPSPQY